MKGERLVRVATARRAVRRVVSLFLVHKMEMAMIDVLLKFGAVGRRLAEAGRQAKGEAMAAAGPAGGQVVEAAALAAGELVRCAVAGAITAVVRGSKTKVGLTVVGRPGVEESDEFDGRGDERIDTPAAAVPPEDTTDRPVSEETTNTTSPRWMSAAGAVGSALSVAAGAAAAVPGGRLVAAGLGAVAAVATLAAKVGAESAG